MPGGGHHRVIDGDHRQRRDRMTGALQAVELGDLFGERATRLQHAEGRLFIHRLADQRRTFLGLFFLQTRGARILALLVAQDAIVGLIERTAQVRAFVGQGKTLAPANVLGLDREGGIAVLRVSLRRRHQVLGMHVVHLAKQDVAAVRGLPGCGVKSPGGIALGQFQGFSKSHIVFQPGLHLNRKAQFVKRCAHQSFKLGPQSRTVERRRFLRTDFLGRVALHELTLDDVQRRQLVVALRQLAHGRFDLEQLGDEVFDVGADFDQQCRFGLGRECLGIQTRSSEWIGQRRRCRVQFLQKL